MLAYPIESNAFIEESRQLLSYMLSSTPATTLEDRNALALWLSHLEERLASEARPDLSPPTTRQGRDEWGGPAELGPGDAGPAWQDKPPRKWTCALPPTQLSAASHQQYWEQRKCR